MLNLRDASPSFNCGSQERKNERAKGVIFFRLWPEQNKAIMRHLEHNSHRIPMITPPSCLASIKAVVCCLIVSLPKGSKHRESRVIWFGAEQVNLLRGVMQSVSALHEDVAAGAELVSCFPQWHCAVEAFQHFHSESRLNFRDLRLCNN